MLQLLLDEHIAPRVADGLRRRHSGLVVFALSAWEQGAFLGQSDSACLLEAARQNMTLVTYDRRTIPPLLKTWNEEGRSHGGVIFVDEQTISPADVGRLVRALSEVCNHMGNLDWANRIVFLQKV